MANNYCHSSSILQIPEGKQQRAQEIIDRVRAELEADPECGYAGFEASLEAGNVWIRDDGENIEADHVAILAQALLDELEIDEPFVFSWAYTCSKPRVDEFGGGACAVRRGKDPEWVDARDTVMDNIMQDR